MATIKFYRVQDPYGLFSNFSPSPILIAGMIWPTVEHYFQASKFEDFRIQDRIRAMESPIQAAIEGRKRTHKLLDNWDEIKNTVMYKALMAKFLQHPELKYALFNTGDATLVEHTANDSYWADGGNGNGKNMLGILLMQVRNQIKQISDVPELVLPPWLAFPETEKFDMFWRMGLGENYFLKWVKYITAVNLEDYRRRFPEPIEWKDTYELTFE